MLQLENADRIPTPVSVSFLLWQPRADFRFDSDKFALQRVVGGDLDLPFPGVAPLLAGRKLRN